MKQLLIVGLLSLGVISCNDSNDQTIEEPTEQDITPGAELGADPMDDEMVTETYTDHFNAALYSLDESHPTEAADHMDLAISALETEGVQLQDSAHAELKTVIEQLDDVTDRIRTGEATDRAEIEQLVNRAETLVGGNQQ